MPSSVSPPVMNSPLAEIAPVTATDAVSAAFAVTGTDGTNPTVIAIIKSTDKIRLFMV